MPGSEYRTIFVTGTYRWVLHRQSQLLLWAASQGRGSAGGAWRSGRQASGRNGDLDLVSG